MSVNKDKIIPLGTAVTGSTRWTNIVEQLSESYSDVLRRYIRRRVVSDEEADEIVQDIFCRLLQHEGSQTLTNPRAFVFRIAYNILTDRWRHNQTVDSVIQTLPREKEHGSYSYLDFNELVAGFYEVLNNLTSMQKRVFVMRRYHGLSTSEISVALGISVRMTQKHLADALRKFHVRLR